MSREDEEYRQWFEESDESEDDDEAESDQDAEADDEDDDPETIGERASDDEEDEDERWTASPPPGTGVGRRTLGAPPCHVTIGQGDCLTSLAWHYRLPVDTIWTHAENADLRHDRSRSKLLPGDKLFIPAPDPTSYDASTESTARFILKLPQARLKVKLLRGFEPRAQVDYVIKVGDLSIPGTTDGSGLIDTKVPPLAQEATLTVKDQDGEERYVVRLGHLDPKDADTGVQARLNNLGFSAGAIDGDVGDRTRGAVAAFQASQGLPVTGEVDDQLRQRLEELHES